MNKILFIDIETTRIWDELDSVPDAYHRAFIRKHNDPDTQHQEWRTKAGLSAIFGKIICISVGYYRDDQWKAISYYHEDERKLLKSFGEMLDKCVGWDVCGHNIKNFDIPYILRRMIKHQISIPKLIDTRGLKPWEQDHIKDTMEMWGVGEWKHRVSLDQLCAAFGVDTPKEDISGKEVADVYFAGGLDRIVKYCEKDIYATAQVYAHMVGVDVSQQPLFA